MGKEVLIVLLGIWVALQSFLGFPLWIDEVLFGVLGLSIATLGFVLYRESAVLHRHADTFAEHTPEVEDEIELPVESHESSLS